jgi:hypothetical protein
MRFIMLAVILASASVQAQETGDFVGPSLTDHLQTYDYQGPASLCEGDACDLYLPVMRKTVRFENTSGRRKWGALLGGLSGALIGDEVAGAPGAVLLGSIGAFAGYENIDRDRWEANARRYDQAWQRGDDISYNPAHPLPLRAHWMYAGPPPPDPVKE